MGAWIHPISKTREGSAQHLPEPQSQLPVPRWAAQHLFGDVVLP